MRHPRVFVPQPSGPSRFHVQYQRAALATLPTWETCLSGDWRNAESFLLLISSFQSLPRSDPSPALLHAYLSLPIDLLLPLLLLPVFFGDAAACQVPLRRPPLFLLVLVSIRFSPPIFFVIPLHLVLHLSPMD